MSELNAMSKMQILRRTKTTVTVSYTHLEYVLVGTFSYIAEGEMIEASGRMTEHPIYGEQMEVESYELKAPEDTVSMERYLGSGAIKGVGAALASRIVKKFKADTFLSLIHICGIWGQFSRVRRWRRWSATTGNLSVRGIISGKNGVNRILRGQSAEALPSFMSRRRKQQAG